MVDETEIWTDENYGELSGLLKPWPNGDGWSYFDWDIVERDGVFIASRAKLGDFPDLVGRGKSWSDAIMRAKWII